MPVYVAFCKSCCKGVIFNHNPFATLGGITTTWEMQDSALYPPGATAVVNQFGRVFCGNDCFKADQRNQRKPAGFALPAEQGAGHG
jgi:hypothetical protein